MAAMPAAHAVRGKEEALSKRNHCLCGWNSVFDGCPFRFGYEHRFVDGTTCKLSMVAGSGTNGSNVIGVMTQGRFH